MYAQFKYTTGLLNEVEKYLADNFTEEKLKNYGHLLPRRRVEGAHATHSGFDATGWSERAVEESPIKRPSVKGKNSPLQGKIVSSCEYGRVWYSLGQRNRLLADGELFQLTPVPKQPYTQTLMTAEIRSLVHDRHEISRSFHHCRLGFHEHRRLQRKGPSGCASSSQKSSSAIR